MAAYTLYMLRCADGTYYTGITTDIERRLKEHNESNKGAKYTKSRRPVKLVYTKKCATRSVAQKREYILRTSSRSEKERLAKAAS